MPSKRQYESQVRRKMIGASFTSVRKRWTCMKLGLEARPAVGVLWARSDREQLADQELSLRELSLPILETLQRTSGRPLPRSRMKRRHTAYVRNDTGTLGFSARARDSCTHRGVVLEKRTTCVETGGASGVVPHVQLRSVVGVIQVLWIWHPNIELHLQGCKDYFFSHQ